MEKDEIDKERKELLPEEIELARMLDFYSQDFTVKSLAKELYATEEQVRTYLSNLGLLDMVSKERIAERKRTRKLGQQAFEALVRAAQERR